MKKVLALVLGATLLFAVGCDKKGVNANQANKKVAITEEQGKKSTNEQKDNKKTSENKDTKKTNSPKVAKVDTTNKVKQASTQPKVEPAVQKQAQATIAAKVEPAAQTPEKPVAEEPAKPVEPEQEQPVAEEPAKPADNSVGDNNTTEAVTNNEIGLIKNVYLADEKMYVSVDMVEFYRGAQATEEAEKDGKEHYDGYYVRNTDSTLTTYEVADNAQYYLCGFIADRSSNSGDLVNVSKETFVQFINDYGSAPYGNPNLCWVTTTNGIANCIKMQFTP